MRKGRGGMYHHNIQKFCNNSLKSLAGCLHCGGSGMAPDITLIPNTAVPPAFKVQQNSCVNCGSLRDIVTHLEYQNQKQHLPPLHLMALSRLTKRLRHRWSPGDFAGCRCPIKLDDDGRPLHRSNCTRIISERLEGLIHLFLRKEWRPLDVGKPAGQLNPNMPVVPFSEYKMLWHQLEELKNELC